MFDSKVHVLDHPLLQHKLSILRDERTGVKEFREIVSEIATLECYEATRDLPLEDVEIKTPVATGTFKCLTGKKLAIVPILRAGLGMVDGILTLIPSAKVGHIGLYRDPETLAPVEYYCKMPHDIAERDVIVLDPMLATGGSAVAAIQFLKNYECRSIKLMNILAAPEGIQAVRTAHPDVDIYVAAVDEKLNDHGYIVPGLGDAGDRIFGTKDGSDTGKAAGPSGRKGPPPLQCCQFLGCWGLKGDGEGGFDRGAEFLYNSKKLQKEAARARERLEWGSM